MTPGITGLPSKMKGGDRVNRSRKSEWERVEQRASWVEQRATGSNKYIGYIKGNEKLTEKVGWMENHLNCFQKEA